ncbi:MAG TPA: hypothetical protein VLL52_01805 [Anaerolineae bacterium]|nr:hypothetical protein [Anaerolineae bacterium]
MMFRYKWLGIWGLLLCLMVAVPAQGQEGNGVGCEQSRVIFLLERLEGATCEELLALHDGGIGWGVLMQAGVVGEVTSADWRALVAAHGDDGVGWGQIGRAYALAERLGDESITAEMLLGWHGEGLGWGQIRHAHALSEEVGMEIEEAVALFAEGQGWGEIRRELGLPPGPPPWAGNPNGRGNGASPGGGNGGGQGNGRNN